MLREKQTEARCLFGITSVPDPTSCGFFLCSKDGEGWKVFRSSTEHTCALPVPREKVKSTPFTPDMFVRHCVDIVKSNPEASGKLMKALCQQASKDANISSSLTTA